MSSQPEVLTVAEVADRLRISVSHVKRLAQKGEMPGTLPKLGRQWRFSRQAIDDLINTDVQCRAQEPAGGGTDADGVGLGAPPPGPVVAPVPGPGPALSGDDLGDPGPLPGPFGGPAPAGALGAPPGFGAFPSAL